MLLDQYAVVGQPVSHSLSPRIHLLFAQQTQQQLSFVKLEAPKGFLAAVSDFRARGGRGLSVTLPFKEEAFAFVTAPTERAQRSRAVNVIHFSGGQVIGDNTDGLGFCRDMEINQGINLRGKRILIVGCGGATRGLLPSLVASDPQHVLLTNRTLLNARRLAEEFAHDQRVLVATSAELETLEVDIVVNATSAGWSGDVPELPTSLVRPDRVFYDLSYGAQKTPFLRWVSEHGATRCIDGLGMVVEQAAYAFERWRSVHPKTKPVIAQIAQDLGRAAPEACK